MNSKIGYENGINLIQEYQMEYQGSFRMNGEIMEEYTEYITGGDRVSNYIAMLTLFLFGFGFSIAGISSYSNIDIIANRNFSSIEFIPQGILLLFYGTCALLLSSIIGLLIKFDVGGGSNTFDVINNIVRLSRRGLPSLTFTQEPIFLVYSFNEIENIELAITNSLNPKRIIYINLKDKRRIPLTNGTKLESLEQIENNAIFLSILLEVKLEINKEEK